MKYIHVACLVKICIVMVNCDHKEDVKNKNPLPYFRRELDAKLEKKNTEGLSSYDPQSNLVSFLVNNVDKVFTNVDDVTDPYENFTTIPKYAYEMVKSTLKVINKNIEEDPKEYPKLKDDIIDYDNKTLSNIKVFEQASPVNELEMPEKRVLMLLAREMKSREKTEQSFYDTNALMEPSNKEAIKYSELNNPYKRSCISCNNVMYEECSDPRNKLLSSIVCENEADICYSQHTPFGIVDRGCFNVNQNLSTYVCSCNLCNYISISEMPYIFSNKRDWVDNVIEMSRTNNFRKSIFKSMACMRCEVNTTTQKGNILDSANCLEGNIGSVPTQVCEENEICAVKAIKSQGYMWRGCVKMPLYNYWWTICDVDLCNYDRLISIYDFL